MKAENRSLTRNLSSLNRIAARIHACGEGTIERNERLIFLPLRGILLSGLVVARLPSAGHGSDNRPDPRTLARIACDRADYSATRRAARGSDNALAAAHCGPRWRKRGVCDRHWIDSGRLSGPSLTFAAIARL
jgi:hypothetical protein